MFTHLHCVNNYQYLHLHNQRWETTIDSHILICEELKEGIIIVWLDQCMKLKLFPKKSPWKGIVAFLESRESCHCFFLEINHTIGLKLLQYVNNTSSFAQVFGDNCIKMSDSAGDMWVSNNSHRSQACQPQDWMHSVTHLQPVMPDCSIFYCTRNITFYMHGKHNFI